VTAAVSEPVDPSEAATDPTDPAVDPVAPLSPVVPGVALVRVPGPRLPEGIVTHIGRTPVDVPEARRQHAAYRAALEGAGWSVVDVEPADDCPDAVFVEDALVVCDGLAVVTRPGADARLAETEGAERAAREAGLEVVRIVPPGTLDGGDVLQVGDNVYVGRGGRSNDEGIAQLRDHLATRGRTVVPVTLRGVLHLKSAVTALPDGTLLALPDMVEPGVLPPVLPVEEETGCHVVPLGAEKVLIASSAPHTAELIRQLGFVPVVVDIGEYERLEGCVTCLSVLIPAHR
jgi:dimethylargininase